MRDPRSLSRNRKRGQILLFILLFCIMILTTAVISNMMLTSQLLTESVKRVDADQAFWIAMAGIQESLKGASTRGVQASAIGTVQAIPWQANAAPVTFGTYTASLTSSQATGTQITATQGTATQGTGTQVVQGTVLQSAGNTLKNLITCKLTAQVNAQTFKVISFQNPNSP